MTKGMRTEEAKLAGVAEMTSSRCCRSIKLVGLSVPPRLFQKKSGLTLPIRQCIIINRSDGVEREAVRKIEEMFDSHNELGKVGTGKLGNSSICLISGLNIVLIVLVVLISLSALRDFARKRAKTEEKKRNAARRPLLQTDAGS